MEDGSELFQRLAANEWDNDDKRHALMLKVWSPTPWMLNAFTGDEQKLRDIREWCAERYGPEGWPIHDRPGRWYVGSATIHGWTWMGFDTEAAMNEFAAAFPAPTPGEQHDRD